MMNRMVSLSAAAAVLALSGIASAGIANYAPGSVVFTDADGDRIGVSNVGIGLPNTTFLHNLAGGPSAARNPSQITLGGDGNWYVGDGQFDVSQPGRILRIANLFGAPVESVLVSGTPGDPGSVLDNPTGVRWDAGRNSLVVIDNPGNALNPSKQDNLFLVGLGGAVQTSFTEPADNPGFPYYQDGNVSQPDRNTSNMFVVAPNGGLANQGGNQFNNPGALWRMSFDGFGNATASLFYDFSDLLPGTLVGQPKAMASAVNGDGSQDLYVADDVTNGIYRIIVNSDGTFGGASLIFSNPGLANGLGEIQYDPFNDKLVFSSEGTQQILRINRNGTGLETIANGVRVRGIYIIPTPGAISLAGLAGLAMIRRRR